VTEPTPGIVAKHDQQDAERKDASMEQVKHEARVTGARFKAFAESGLSAEQSWTLTRDWHSASFCEGMIVSDDGEPV
jgi:hypothetical protein